VVVAAVLRHRTLVGRESTKGEHGAGNARTGVLTTMKTTPAGTDET